METIETILRFAGSYPMWARLVVLACFSVAVVTLVLAAPQSDNPVATTSGPPQKGQQVFIRIRAIKLFPENPNAEVQLSIFVNGTEYKHPSVAGVEWMKVGPTMSEKLIELPTSPRYEVRFEMRLREGPTLRMRQQVSQQVTPIKTLPYSEEYNLYQVENKTRSAGVSAVVPYEVFTQ